MGAYLSWTDAKYLYSILRFDTVEEESATFDSEITSHAVELGANVSDHVRNVAPSGSLTAFVSMKPSLGASLVNAGQSDGFPTATLLRYPAYTPQFYPTPGGLLQAIGGLVSGPPPTQQSVTVLSFATPVNRPEQVLQVLAGLKASAQLLEVNAPSYTLKDCLLKSINVTRGPDDGQGLNFALEFQGIRRVSSKRTDQVLPADIKAKKKTDKGNKGGEEVPAQSVSWLASGLGAAVPGGGFGSP